MRTKPLGPRKLLGAFATLLSLNFFLSLHYAATLYVNSSFLGEFFSPEGVSILYVVASLFVMVLLANGAHIVRWTGIWIPFLVSTVLLQCFILFFGFATNPVLAVVFFIIQSMLIFIVSYFLDLYVESVPKDETKTGNLRSLYITSANVGIFLGPLVVSVLVIGDHFTPSYIFAALALIPVLILGLTSLKQFTPALPTHTSFREAFKDVSCCRRNVRDVMVIHFLMQLFNTVIAIYAPLYLFEVGGMSWQAIGSLIALALLPYLVLEIPLGFVADRIWSEKELMVVGLTILGVSLILMTVTPLSLFLWWSVWFVTTRIGGAIVEIATESYFFKQVTEEEATLIGGFRMLSPLGRVVAPLIALAVLSVAQFSILFAVFGVIILAGVPLALRVVDTR